jgi:protein-S-isoprenylcysteine O-methyltransferase Ste14
MALSLYWLIAVAVVGACFLFSAVIKERSMARLFLAACPPYRHTTTMLIPHLL